MDTNILSYLIKGNVGVQNHFLKRSESIFLPSIVYVECLFGAKKVNSKRLVKVYNQIFDTYPNLPFNIQAAKIFTDQKVSLTGKGLGITDFDLMIASICLANNLVLVTHNTKHFENIPDLKIEDWTV